MVLSTWLARLTAPIIDRLETTMSDLTASIDRLTTAVTGVGDRVGQLTTEHEAKVAELTALIEQERALDATEDADYDAKIADLHQQIDAKTAELSAVAGQISDQADRLAEVAKAPEVETPEPTPAPEPTPEPEAPVEETPAPEVVDPAADEPVVDAPVAETPAEDGRTA